MNGRSWKIVLVVSLVLNVFLLGAIVGGAYQWFAAHRRECVGAGAGAAARACASRRSRCRRRSQQAFVDGLKDARREGRQFAREGREGRREVLRLLAAPQLDRAALDAALARTRAADSSLRAKVEGSVADFAATLVARGARRIRRQPEIARTVARNAAGGQCESTGQAGSEKAQPQANSPSSETSGE